MDNFEGLQSLHLSSFACSPFVSISIPASAPEEAQSTGATTKQPRKRASKAGGSTRARSQKNRASRAASERTSKSQSKNKPTKPKKSSLNYYPLALQPILMRSRVIMGSRSYAAKLFFSFLKESDAVRATFRNLVKESFAEARVEAQNGEPSSFTIILTKISTKSTIFCYVIR